MHRKSWIATLLLLGCSSQDADNPQNLGGQDASDAQADLAPAETADHADAAEAADVTDASDGTDSADGTDGAHHFMPDHGCQTGANCSDGGACSSFGDAGPGACVTPTTPPAQCPPSSGECCSNTDCERGTCVAVTTQPVLCSATAGFDVRNRCLTDDCADDSDCPSGSICTPAGYELHRSCMVAGCRNDADCSAESGGACVLIHLGCVGDACSDVQRGCCAVQIGGSTRRKSEVACAYPSDGCQSDNDCPGGFCTVADGRARCTSACH